MTTIAYDGQKLCSDSQVTSGDTIISMRQKKIYKIYNHKIYKAFGFSGQIKDWPPFLKWIKDGMNENKYKSMDHGSVMAITHKNKIHIYSGDLPFEKINEKQYAIGSGRDFALAVMHQGGSAVNAIEAAKRFDLWTGGPKQTITI